MARNRAVYWLAGLGIAAILLLIGGMTTGRPAFAGFTPTPTPAPLLPEVGGRAPSPWPLLALGAAALLAGWMVRRKRT